MLFRSPKLSLIRPPIRSTEIVFMILRLRFPFGAAYTRTMPPNPDHGLSITMNDQTRLWVDVSYTDSSSSEEEARKQIAGCRVEENRSTMLGRMPAILVRFSCGDNEDVSAYREQLVLSVRLGKNRSPICYQIGMKTNGATSTRQADELFKELVAGFRSPG